MVGEQITDTTEYAKSLRSSGLASGNDLCESKEPLGWDRKGLPVQLYVGSTKRPGAARGTLSTDNRAC